jgi:hypothetical protein
LAELDYEFPPEALADAEAEADACAEAVVSCLVTNVINESKTIKKVALISFFVICETSSYFENLNYKTSITVILNS